MKKVTEEFKKRIPIVRAYFMRGSSVLEDSELYIRYVVETAAIEDSIDSHTYAELTERTRDELLFSGYFRERGQDVLSVLVVSEERLQNERNDYYLRWG
ncbi:MAG: hypothetical protein IT365_06485 [Candidatus Hydrogenedentes bacterium]|nr:hypothetical protein [Candidatus Hydrogenedentota bacterium]